MRKIFLALILCALSLQSAYLEEKRWDKGQSFLTFLEKNGIPLSIYYDLDREDRELATEIRSNTKYQVLKNDFGEIEQVLIPVGEELQLHLIKDKDTKKYSLKTTPIYYEQEELSAVVEVKNSPYRSIVKATNSRQLANEFISAYKKSVNFKGLKRGDKLVIFYTQRKRLGKGFSEPTIQAAMTEIGDEKRYVFLYDDSTYFNELGKEIEGYLLKMPLNRYKRISSKFTYKRWHPILKRYRAHLGIDYAARSGTPVRAAGNGRVSYKGRKGGYGKMIEIRHKSGYKTLYAHLRGYKKGLKRGQKVTKGQLIGYVGSTGMSTGPHLHFGLYKNNRAINPNKVIKITKNSLTGKKKKKFLAHVKHYKKRFKMALNDKKQPLRENNFRYIVSLEQAKKTHIK